MKKIRWFLMGGLVLIFVSCGEPAPPKEERTLTEMEQERLEQEKSNRENCCDSLGNPFYYRYPDITKMDELKEILVQADSVIGYNYNEHDGNPAMVECEDIHQGNGKLCATAQNRKKLTSAQAKEFTMLVNDTTNYTGDWASGAGGTCFIPHVGFLFMHEGKISATVNICFLCSGIRGHPSYKSDILSEAGNKRMYKFVQKIGLEIVDGTTELTY